MLVPLAPRLLLLVLVSLQTHSTLFLVPALELVNAFIPEDALVLVALSDAPPGVSQLLRTLGKHLLSSLLPLRRRKVKRRRLVLVLGHLLPLGLRGFHPGLWPGLIPLLILRFDFCVEVSPLCSPPTTVCEVADSVICQVAMLPSFNSL